MPNITTQDQVRDRLGNIDQIRSLLFGAQIEEYSQKFGSYEERIEIIEADVEGFKAETRTRINQLQSNLSEEIRTVLDSLEKKIKYLNINGQETNGNLQRDLNALDNRLSGQLELFNQTFSETISDLRDELGETRETLSTDLQKLRKEAFAKLNEYFSEVQEHKVSRKALADIFFDVCLQLKESEGEETAGTKEKAEEIKMLPEQQLPE
jgi:DNA anti-recombination protein RmuC